VDPLQARFLRQGPPAIPSLRETAHAAAVPYHRGPPPHDDPEVRSVARILTAGLRRLGVAPIRFAFRLGRRRPPRLEVLLATSTARALSGNLAAIRDDLAVRHPEIPVRVFAHAQEAGVLGRLRMLWHGAVAGYRLAGARVVIVDDYFLPLYAVRPRPATTVAQVWHACGAFKKFGYSLAGKSFGADGASLAPFPIHVNYDLCLVSARSVAPAYAEAFRQPLELFVAELGIPRTDVLIDPARAGSAAEYVRRRYGLTDNRKVILYAPTFRGDRTTEARDPQGLDVEVLRQTVGEDHVLLVRSHPFVRRRRPSPKVDEFVVDVSDYPEMNELMLAADVLITDYSSAIFEFALLGRPIVFFAPDHAAYERERGFYFDFATGAPGPIFEETEPLASFLRQGQFDLARIRQFAKNSFDVADGKATARFVERVVLPAVAGVKVRPEQLRDSP
jgi:CDP-glycerol glycerophosphotransferase (TagB/SpsB family)